MPPDAFTVRGPPPAEIALFLEFASGEPPIEYLLRRSHDGLLTDFPVYLWGAFFPAALTYDTPGQIGGFTINTPVPWNIEFLEYDDETLPVIARAGCGETWFFAVFRYSGQGVSETWYDQEGTALAVFTFTYTQWNGSPLLRSASLTGLAAGGARIEYFHYDSLGNLSAVSTADGEFTAGYHRTRPQYWKRPYPAAEGTSSEAEASRTVAGKFALQWDERGFLTRLSSQPAESRPPGAGSFLGENSPSGGEAETDLCYEYTQDEHNNWTERREVTPISRFDYLIPYAGETIRRRIAYFEPEIHAGGLP
ncbi:hypothetical protein AGMMS49991_03040 [Spirochaetia bacterium]|nr:hypothetical protein AGMMS49991_03040 [Spirochaetia bacterium]